MRLAVEDSRGIGHQCATGGDIGKTCEIGEHVHQFSYLKSALRARHEVKVDEAIHRGADTPEKFLNLRIPQIDPLLGRTVKKYQKSLERIKALDPS